MLYAQIGKASRLVPKGKQNMKTLFERHLWTVCLSNSLPESQNIEREQETYSTRRCKMQCGHWFELQNFVLALLNLAPIQFSHP